MSRAREHLFADEKWRYAATVNFENCNDFIFGSYLFHDSLKSVITWELGYLMLDLGLQSGRLVVSATLRKDCANSIDPNGAGFRVKEMLINFEGLTIALTIASCFV